MWRPERRDCAALLKAFACLALAAAPAAAGQYDPTFQFRTITTPHFVIHFHQGEELLAARLAVEAERVHERLALVPGVEVTGPTHVVLRDQSDRSNAFASVLPHNTIVIEAVPPAGDEYIGNTDDWLRDVFTHEYVHILHLDRSRGWARAVRAVFGRSPVAFPNLSLPLWQIEGLATLLESSAGRGRVQSGGFRAIVDEAARTRRFEPIDRVNGGLVDWPGGQGWYAYGALFHEFLAERYGATSLRRLADRTAGRLHYFTAPAFREEYGRSLGELWQEFEAERRDAAATSAGDEGRRLTRLGFEIGGLRRDHDGGLLFTAADPHGFPSIRRLAPNASAPERVLDRFGGTGLAVTRDVLLFDQLELARNVALHSDLYLHHRSNARTRRLTREARLLDPDLSPDGTRVAAVRIVSGGRELVILDAARLFAARQPIGPDQLPVLRAFGPPGAVFASPRWSPDGRWIAVERGPAPQQIVVIREDGTERRIVGVAGGRSTTPSWTPGGNLLFAAERGQDSPALYLVEISAEGTPQTIRPVVHTPGGAHSPLALDGETVAAARYGPEGFDVWAFPVRAGAAVQASGIVPAEPAGSEMPIVPESAPYSPWPTLAPRGWLPLIDYRDGRWHAGATATGVDVLARHVVSVSSTWAVAGGGAPADLVSRSRPDWSASYVYQRWRPAFYAATSDRTSLFQAVTDIGAVVPVAQREQQLDAGVVLPVRRVRWAQMVRAAFHLEHVTTEAPDEEAATTRAGARLGWTIGTARRYGYSVSVEDGYRAGVTAEAFSPVLGSEGRGEAFSGDGRLYRRIGRGHAVVALRAAAAVSSGDQGFRRVYRLGGADGDPAPGAFGSEGISLLRGFGDSTFAGTHVALANAEFRVPLWRPQRGPGTWPLFLRAVHAAAFLDVGHAWTDRFRWPDRKTGAGIELSADVVFAFGLPVTCTVGAGWGHDGAGAVPDGSAVYFRVGPSF